MLQLIYRVSPPVRQFVPLPHTINGSYFRTITTQRFSNPAEYKAASHPSISRCSRHAPSPHWWMNAARVALSSSRRSAAVVSPSAYFVDTFDTFSSARAPVPGPAVSSSRTRCRDARSGVAVRLRLLVSVILALAPARACLRGRNGTAQRMNCGLRNVTCGAEVVNSSVANVPGASVVRSSSREGSRREKGM